MLSSVQGLAPVCAPVLGGILLGAMDWKGIFWILLAIGILLIVCPVCLQGNRWRLRNAKKGMSFSTFKYYLPVLRNRQFMRYVLIQAFAMGVMFTYIAASPFIFQNHFGTSPFAYSLCFGVNALGIMLGSLAVSRFKDATAALRFGVAGFTTMSLPVAAALIFSPSVWIVEGTLFFLLAFLGINPSRFHNACT